jgi:transcriptional regulator
MLENGAGETMTLYVKERYAKLKDDSFATLMRESSLALVITCTDSGPCLSHLPILVPEAWPQDELLYGHIAIENPHYAVLSTTRQCTLVFSGPNAYMSPAWYRTFSPEQSPPRFPTWNYAVVHVTGDIEFAEDVSETDWILDAMIRHFEAQNGTFWNPSAYPNDRRAVMRQQIAAFKFRPTKIEPKFKLNQYHNENEVLGAALGLYTVGTPSARAIAAMMQEALSDISI